MVIRSKEGISHPTPDTVQIYECDEERTRRGRNKEKREENEERR
jgi:hypothetical protein